MRCAPRPLASALPQDGAEGDRHRSSELPRRDVILLQTERGPHGKGVMLWGQDAPCLPLGSKAHCI